MVRTVGAGKVKLLCEVVPEAAQTLDKRKIDHKMKTMDQSFPPYAYCIAGMKPGMPPSLETLRAWGGTGKKIIISTGMKKENIKDYLSYADGAIVGSALKKDGNLFSHVDEARVREFMEIL